MLKKVMNKTLAPLVLPLLLVVITVTITPYYARAEYNKALISAAALSSISTAVVPSSIAASFSSLTATTVASPSVPTTASSRAVVLPLISTSSTAAVPLTSAPSPTADCANYVHSILKSCDTNNKILPLFERYFNALPTQEKADNPYCYALGKVTIEQMQAYNNEIGHQVDAQIINDYKTKAKTLLVFYFYSNLASTPENRECKDISSLTTHLVEFLIGNDDIATAQKIIELIATNNLTAVATNHRLHKLLAMHSGQHARGDAQHKP